MYAILIPIVAMCIPIVAILGGITAAIFRTRGTQAVAELAMRERIAAIEKGIDPATLPPPPPVGDPGEVRDDAMTPADRAYEIAQGLHIAAAITTTAGVGLGIMLGALLHGEDKPYWVIGILPMFVGLGLWLAGRVVEKNAARKARPA